MGVNIRNFVIIAHIDHGKSTLADRFLEITKTVKPKDMRPQYLDNMPVERERGITIRMQPVRMVYEDNEFVYILNLIDTPGHVDFSYEVSRSLAAVEGAIVLVDATQGVQAQTLSNLEMAQRQGLSIIPVVNKIDLPGANIDQVSREISNLVHVEPEDVLKVSAKYGDGCKEVLGKICRSVPAPEINLDKPLRALIFDSIYDSFKGVIAYVKIVDGEVKKGDDIFTEMTGVSSKVKEVGFFKPNLSPCSSLKSGEIGYIATGIKDPRKIKVGDTITLSQSKDFIKVLPGYKEPKPMLFASLFCQKADDYELLKSALTRLKLNDASLEFEPDSKSILGRGFKCGFLGQLHMEIVVERLRRDFGLDLIISFPSISYKVIDISGQEKFISSAQDWPEETRIKKTLEQYARLKIIIPVEYVGIVMEFLKKRRAHYISQQYLSSSKIILVYELPLPEIMFGFYQEIKNYTRGYGSMSYEVIGWKPSQLTKLEIFIAGKKREEFSRIVPQEDSYQIAKNIAQKIKDNIPNQLFSVPIQVKEGGRIIVRETIKARRKDVIAPLYGGDYTRKRKLLEKQKKGKRKMQQRTSLRLSSDILLKIFKSE